MVEPINLAPVVTQLYAAALHNASWPAAWAAAGALRAGHAPAGAALLVVADGGVPAPLGGPGWSGHAVRGGSVALAVVAESEAAIRAASVPREDAVQMAEHMRLAQQVRARLAAADLVQAAQAAALAAAGVGVIIVTAGGRAVHADAGAERLAAEAGLIVSGPCGGMRAAEPAATEYLSNLIQDAAAGGRGGDMLLRGRAVMVAVHVAALEGDDGLGGQATVRLQRLGAMPACPRRIAALFGMTRAEAGVAVAVASGQPVAAVAVGRGVAASTVQAQVRSALDKAGVTDVSELGALLARLG